MRGDKGDNVFPAYPRVRADRLKKALTDEYERTKIMNETWKFTDPESGAVTEYRVGDLFEENQLLMNLEKQPPEIRQIIDDTLDKGVADIGKFSHFHFSKFCGKFGLKQIADDATSFTNMFSMTPAKAAAKAAKKPLLEF